MRTFTLLFICAAVLFQAMPGQAGEKKEVKTVEWFMQKENKAALEETLKRCQNNPGEMKNDPNCENAQTADRKLFINAPMINLR